MGSKSLSQEYDFSEGDESPFKTYKPLRSLLNENTKTTVKSEQTDSALCQTRNEIAADTVSAKSDSMENIDPHLTQIQRKVIYMYSKYVIDTADRMIKVPKRASLVSSLIEAYGLHKYLRDCASGFCYTNDVVLGILKLREKFSRVLYVDLDLHHGDGVEDAFCSTNKVMTVSVHKHAAGFFPGRGSVKDTGLGKGKYYSVNIPLKDGVKDAEFAALVCRVLVKVKDKFDPEAVVCQCGADGLAGDPMESFNLTSLSLGKCVYTLLSWKLPVLLLGGGGYNHQNTARCWTYLTGIAVGRKLNKDIPEHRYLMKYGPGYELSVAVGNKRDQNTQEYLQAIYSDILYNLNQLSSTSN
ncbi:histone deacetylase 8-like [Mercenaria mercenaria]|uniref:histone deacetylase 8-like n=1 Tax=Mercenaria mercenaria TaxID=6596 RepID=UPI00234ED0DB|nr:histone deacetylase 8-like [Mercenaria mercenaria]